MEEIHQELFAKLEDGTGHISRRQLEVWLENSGMTKTEAELDAVFEYADQNGDGVIDFDEFKDIMIMCEEGDGPSADRTGYPDHLAPPPKRRRKSSVALRSLLECIREKIRSVTTTTASSTPHKSVLGTMELHRDNDMKYLVSCIESADPCAGVLTELGLEDILPRTVPVIYKNVFQLQGTRFLHFAAAYSTETGIKPLKFLLRALADANAVAHYVGYGDVRCQVQAIHIAAFLGCIAHVEYLLLFRADVNARNIHGDVEHATPLHDAAFGQHADIVSLLVAKKADANLKDKKTMQPLHIVAQQGCCEKKVEQCVKSLIQGKASLSEKIEATTDNNTFNAQLVDKTPLQIAADPRSSCSFPKHILYLLAESSWGAAGEGACLLEELFMIAKLNRGAAEVFTQQIKSSSCPNHAVSREQLMWEALNEPANSNTYLINIVKLAPRAGADILEMLTQEPRVQAPQQHALPTCVDLSSAGSIAPMLCSYQSDCDKQGRPWWSYGGKGVGSWPPWHWSQKPIGGDSIYNVKVSVVWLPDLLTVPLVWALARTWLNYDILGQMPVQGIIACLWDGLVYKVFSFNWLREALVLVVLARFNMRLPGTSFMWIILVTNVVSEMTNVARRRWAYRRLSLHLSYGRLPYLSFENFATVGLALIVGIRLVDYISFKEGERQDSIVETVLVSLTTWARFFQLTYGLRAFNRMGKTILSVFQSLLGANVLGIMLVSLLFFGGILSVFLMIKGPESWVTVIIALFKALVLADGDGLGTLGSLPGADAEGRFASALTYIATPFFTLYVLNLFTAVCQDEYTDAQRRSGILFLKSRADICCHYMLQNIDPNRNLFILHSVPVRAIGAVLAFAFLLVFSLDEGPMTMVASVVAVVCLFCLQDFCETSLMNCGWDLEKPNFLWICHRDDPDSWRNCEHVEEKVESLGEKVESLERRLDDVTQAHAIQLSQIQSSLEQVLANQEEILGSLNLRGPALPHERRADWHTPM